MRNARGQQSRRGFYLALLVVAVLGAAGITWATRRSAPEAITVDPALAAGAKAEGYVIGNPNAPVEIVEFLDFECPGCAQFATVTEPDVMQRLVAPGKARLRVFDLQIIPQHRNAPAASLAAACAHDQGKFSQMHDRIFAGQNDWNTQATDDPKSILVGYARELGLDEAKFTQCYDARTHVGRLAAHQQEAERRGVRGTPTFIVGGKQINASISYDVIKAYVDSAAATAGAAPAGAAPAAAAPAPQPATP